MSQGEACLPLAGMLAPWCDSIMAQLIQEALERSCMLRLLVLRSALMWEVAGFELYPSLNGAAWVS